MLTIYGSDLSSPASKVRFVANYLGLTYEYKQINLRAKEQKEPWFLAINPVGKVPAMKDGDFCLFESGTICKYLCDKNTSDLYPKDLKQRALVDQWNDFVVLHIAANMAKIVFNRVFAPRRNLPVSQESIADGVKFLEDYFPIIEKQLTMHTYLTGATLSIADMALLASIDPCVIADVKLDKYPKLMAFQHTLKQQSFYTQCYKEYGESLK